MLIVDDLEITFGEKILFKEVSLHLSKKKRYGLVGANGAGKTTFLQALAGELPATSGTINIPKDATLSLLKQDAIRHQNEQILTLVLKGHQKLYDAIERKQQLLCKNDLTEKEIEELSSIEEQLRLCQGYQAEARAARLLLGLGVPTEKQQKQLSVLSGGYQLRVLLAQALFSEPDILLLDEPTNYLDIFSIQYLEGELKQFAGTLILSSHDRLFLSQVCQNILDVDYGTIKLYRCGFNEFLEKKALEIERKEAELKTLGRRKEEVQQFIDRFRAKSSKARQAQSRTRMIKKLEKEEQELEIIPTSRQYPHFAFHPKRPSGRLVLSLSGIQKGYDGRRVLQNLSFEIERGEKVALVGANGMGKSTLLEIVSECKTQDKGSFRLGPHVSMGYFPQNFERLLSPELSLYDWLESRFKDLSKEKLRQALGAVFFREREIRQKIEVLSGGERARLVFASMMLQENNFLLLDEPTNHLDVEATDALIEALTAFSGSLLLVSHNRYFISKIADRIIELREGGFFDFQGGYQEFVAAHERDYLSDKPSKPPSNTQEKKGGQETRRLRKEHRKEVRQCESTLEKIEKQLNALHTTLASSDFYEKTPQEKQQHIIKEMDKLTKEQEYWYARWQALSEKEDFF